MKSRRTVDRQAGSRRARTSSRPDSLRFYGDEFIFDTGSGLFYRVNPSASFILRALQVGTEPDKLADEVQSRYAISRSAAVRDIELLRNDLTSLEPFDQVRT